MLLVSSLTYNLLATSLCTLKHSRRLETTYCIPSKSEAFKMCITTWKQIRVYSSTGNHIGTCLYSNFELCGDFLSEPACTQTTNQLAPNNLECPEHTYVQADDQGVFSGFQRTHEHFILQLTFGHLPLKLL
jgi:hypothetical protein